jgi:hypothetical protein
MLQDMAYRRQLLHGILPPEPQIETTGTDANDLEIDDDETVLSREEAEASTTGHVAFGNYAKHLRVRNSQTRVEGRNDTRGRGEGRTHTRGGGGTDTRGHEDNSRETNTNTAGQSRDSSQHNLDTFGKQRVGREWAGKRRDTDQPQRQTGAEQQGQQPKRQHDEVTIDDHPLSVGSDNEPEHTTVSADFFLRSRGYQLYIHLHIFYFKLDIRSPMEYRSIECIAAYNCLALGQTARNNPARVPVIQRPYGCDA